MIITCKECGFENTFKQEQPLHAGFSNLGFLYNDDGNLTLIWNAYDPDYEFIVGKDHPWTLSKKQQAKLESMLKAAPFGGNWAFRNVPRCLKCHEPIGRSIRDDVYFLAYPNSLELDKFENDNGLKKVIK
jgi:hypothetical protein